jgi:hypothetical protein
LPRSEATSVPDDPPPPPHAVSTAVKSSDIAA